MLDEKVFSLDVGGRILTVKFTPLAQQANGSVLVQYGETTVLVTATMGKTDRLEMISSLWLLTMKNVFMQLERF